MQRRFALPLMTISAVYSLLARSWLARAPLLLTRAPSVLPHAPDCSLAAPHRPLPASFKAAFSGHFGYSCLEMYV